MSIKDKLKSDKETEIVKDKETAKKVIKKISKGSGKDKMISAKVNSQTYAQFTKINEANGTSNNSMINMLIATYVREQKGILDEE